MRLLFLASAAALLISCVRFDTFACSEADDCVLNGLGGQCEASGYCSFPDPDCASKSRYSEHAPSHLARECVDTGASGTGTGTTTGSGSEAGTSTDASTDPLTGSETSGGITDCIDLDQDGAGVGEDCAALDCDDDNPSTTDGCVYIGPNGNDTNAGTRDAPWGTFAYAVAALAPGDSLVVLDGRYVQSDAGTLEVMCDEFATSGTAALPIFVRAENTRQAVIDREGRAYGIGVQGCEYWRFRGLAVVSEDNAADVSGAWRAGVNVEGSRQIELRQIFASHSNRYYNEHLVFVGSSEDILLEDVEAHDFFRSGFVFWRSDRGTCRRCYAHSHEATDLPACPDLPDCPDPNDSAYVGFTACPKCSAGSATRGDASFYTEHSNNILYENCVSEGSARGFHILGGLDSNDGRAGAGFRIFQSVSIGDDRSLVIDSNGDSIPPKGLLVEDFVALGSTSTAIEITDPDDLTLRHVSAFGAGGAAIRVREGAAANCTAGACSLELDHVLVEGATGEGIVLDFEPETWSLAFSNVFASGSSDFSYPSISDDPFDDAQGNAHDNLNVAATDVGSQAGECLVYIPQTSNMFDPFGDGTYVGGNMTDAFESGISSGDAIWDSSGAFPCGPDPIEPNQIATEQCSDLATRVGLAETCEPPLPRGP